MMTPVCPRLLNMITEFVLLRFWARASEDLSAIEVLLSSFFSFLSTVVANPIFALISSESFVRQGWLHPSTWRSWLSMTPSSCSLLICRHHHKCSVKCSCVTSSIADLLGSTQDTRPWRRVIEAYVCAYQWLPQSSGDWWRWWDNVIIRNNTCSIAGPIFFTSIPTIHSYTADSVAGEELQSCGARRFGALLDKWDGIVGIDIHMLAMYRHLMIGKMLKGRHSGVSLELARHKHNYR